MACSCPGSRPTSARTKAYHRAIAARGGAMTDLPIIGSIIDWSGRPDQSVRALTELQSCFSRTAALDREILELLAALELRAQPARRGAAARPGLGTVFRIAIFRRDLAAFQRA